MPLCCNLCGARGTQLHLPFGLLDTHQRRNIESSITQLTLAAATLSGLSWEHRPWRNENIILLIFRVEWAQNALQTSPTYSRFKLKR